MIPTPPFTDSSAVTALAAEFGECATSSPCALTATVECRHIDLFAMRLRQIGCAGLRVTVRTGRPITPATVANLATARVARLELTDPIETSTVITWFETAKAAASLGLPLIWGGDLPADVRRHARHLPAPTGDDEWRKGWRYGLLGWRRGPDFAEVLDLRDGHRRTLVDLAAVTAIFGGSLDHPSAFTRAAAELVEAGFAMSFLGEIVWLPYRLKAGTRVPPVPSP